MADTQKTGAEIALSSVGHIDEINRQRLEEELVRENLQLSIEEVRLQVARTQLEIAITRHETDLMYAFLRSFNYIEEPIRINLAEALGKNFINSLHAQYLPIPNQTEAQTSDAETTAEEVPEQNTTDSNIETPTPAPASEAVEAPAENNSQPTTVGSGQSQGK